MSVQVLREATKEVAAGFSVGRAPLSRWRITEGESALLFLQLRWSNRAIRSAWVEKQSCRLIVVDFPLSHGRLEAAKSGENPILSKRGRIKRRTILERKRLYREAKAAEIETRNCPLAKSISSPNSFADVHDRCVGRGRLSKTQGFANSIYVPEWIREQLSAAAKRLCRRARVVDATLFSRTPSLRYSLCNNTIASQITTAAGRDVPFG